jgi:anti-sigma factor RsiW
MSADGGSPGDRREESLVDRCPEDVLGWMPSYVDGVLSEDARQRVEAHAAVCTECRRELDLIAGIPVELDFELPDAGRIFDGILARIGALAAHAAPRAHPDPIQDDRGYLVRPTIEDWSEQDRARLRDWLLAGDAFEEEAHAEAGRDATHFRWAGRRGFWSLGRSWQIAAAVLLVMLGGAGGAILSASLLPEPLGDEAGVVYRPASEAGSTASFQDGELDVVFREDSTAVEIRNALRGLGAEIVAGPSAMGVYRVRVRRRDESLIKAGSADSSRAGVGEPLEAMEAESGRNRLRVVADGLVAPGAGVAVFAEPRS